MFKEILRRKMPMSICLQVSVPLLLAVLTTSSASPANPGGVQLAGFQDLFRLATEGVGRDRMEDRSDRSLANSYPFHLGEKQSSGHSARQGQSFSPLSTGHQAQEQFGHRQDLSQLLPFDTGSSYGSSLGLSYGSSLGSSVFQAPALQTHSGLPASSFRLNHQTQSQAQLGFSLLSGFGSRLNPTSQYQIGSQGYPQNNYAAAHAPSYQAAPTRASSSSQFASLPFATAPAAYPLQDYQQETQLPTISVPDTAAIARGPDQCPAPPSRSAQECQGAVNACWSVGVSDVDCPGNSLCCFDGCAAVCQGQARAVLRPAPSFVNPERRRNPAQKRRKPAGQSFKEVASAGQKCIDKIEQVEELEFDEVEECNHSYDKKCHTSYSTEYETQQEEECDDNYKKACDITYSPHAENVTVRVCMTPLVKDCALAGPEVCRTEYVSECWTKNDPHIVEDDVPSCRTEYEEKCTETQSGYVTEQDCKKWPREVCTVKKELRAKFNPVTKCEKVPQELCGPSGCGFVPGPEECHDQVKTVVTDIPQEVCDLQPQRQCSHVTKLVPKLTPVEECVDVPKEVCHKTKGNPRTVLRPVTKKWCYTPSQESGLA